MGEGATRHATANATQSVKATAIKALERIHQDKSRNSDATRLSETCNFEPQKLHGKLRPYNSPEEAVDHVYDLCRKLRSDGVEVVEDDGRFILQTLYGLARVEIEEAVVEYAAVWERRMRMKDLETANAVRIQNEGRRAANTWLRLHRGEEDHAPDYERSFSS